ncbi:MAG: hypothetical protein H7123_03450, partial [Thermoleophilia bacterium]|nr:hypothetical protein [Thermoleophilia bacterium]
RAERGKFGVYANGEDLEYFNWLWQGDAANAQRTIATQILEAADDLAYAVHDIEDGIWARQIPIAQIAQLEPWAAERIAAVVHRRDPLLFASDDDVANEITAAFGELRDRKWARGPFDRSRGSEAGLKSFCSQLTDELIGQVTAGGSLRWGTDISLQRRIAVLRAVIWVWLIEQPELVTRRHGQRRMMFDLFDGFANEPGMLPYQDEWARVANRGEGSRARFIADHIASMTDTHAIHLHNEMFGTGRVF